MDLITFVLTTIRVIMGLILLAAGLMWLMRADPGGRLTEEIAEPLGSGLTIGFYEPFLESVMLPNADVFAMILGVAGFIAGISLLLGSRTGSGSA